MQLVNHIQRAIFRISCSNFQTSSVRGVSVSYRTHIVKKSEKIPQVWCWHKTFPSKYKHCKHSQLSQLQHLSKSSWVRVCFVCRGRHATLFATPASTDLNCSQERASTLSRRKMTAAALCSEKPPSEREYIILYYIYHISGARCQQFAEISMIKQLSAVCRTVNSEAGDGLSLHANPLTPWLKNLCVLGFGCLGCVKYNTPCGRHQQFMKNQWRKSAHSGPGFAACNFCQSEIFKGIKFGTFYICQFGRYKISIRSRNPTEVMTYKDKIQKFHGHKKYHNFIFERLLSSFHINWNSRCRKKDEIFYI